MRCLSVYECILGSALAGHALVPKDSVASRSRAGSVRFEAQSLITADRSTRHYCKTNREQSAILICYPIEIIPSYFYVQSTHGNLLKKIYNFLLSYNQLHIH